MHARALFHAEPEPVEAWQLRVQVAGHEERYRFTRPEAAEELLLELEGRAARSFEPPTVDALHRLGEKAVLRGDGWSVRRAPTSAAEFLALPTV